jgi:hemolysin III
MQVDRRAGLVTVGLDPLTVRRLPPGKPLLRGWSHLVMAFVGVAFTVALALRCLDDLPRLGSMLLYGAVTVLLFAGSAAYHMGRWSGRVRYWVRLLDHGNIFLKIAGTTTAIGFNVLDGWERLTVLGLVWGCAGTGVAALGWTARRSRWWKVGLYVATGLAGLAALPALLAALPLPAIWLMIGGGALYALGAVIYARKWPNPIPRIFEHHEVFHAFVIAGAVAFAAVIWIWVVPFSRV